MAVRLSGYIHHRLRQGSASGFNFCQVSFDPSVVIGRISNEVTLAADQSQLLQRLGGALGAASGYLAKY
jgi:hypothetical protein